MPNISLSNKSIYPNRSLSSFYTFTIDDGLLIEKEERIPPDSGLLCTTENKMRNLGENKSIKQ